MAGLALGVASLGWCLENALPLHGYGQIVGAVIASCLLGLLVVRFICHFDTLWADLKHPVVGSIVPTFAMALMVISKALGMALPDFSVGLWCFASPDICAPSSSLLFIAFATRTWRRWYRAGSFRPSASSWRT